MTTRICLVRHGETEWNTQRRYQGQLDIGLNAVGEAQARAVSIALDWSGFAAIYASPLQRAWRTAQLAVAASDVAVLPAPTFQERNYGVFQGLTADEAVHLHPRAHDHYHLRTPEYDFETGESLVDFSDRVVTTLEEWSQRHEGQTIAAFTHGGVLDMAHRRATGRPLNGPRDFPIPNAGINWLEIDGSDWRILTWGDTAHLARGQALDEVAR